ncbi:MAG: hypothetical protein JSS07_10560 [Proteobacteria bacterium]|nr:hypothetical protein [Pseudomonadota bacterium]
MKTGSKPTICGVRVATWGAEAGKHYSLGHQIDQELFGGNCGHASISLTIPVTDANKALIKQYCSNPYIPVEKHIIRTPKAKLNDKGEWVVDENAPPLYEEEVYTITFSWWPGAGGFFLSSSINGDGYQERVGVNRAWDARFRKFIDVEERIHTGHLGRTKMAYGAMNIEHQRNLEDSAQQKKYLNIKAQSMMVTSILESLEVVQTKIIKKQKDFERINLRKERIENKDIILNDNKNNIKFLQSILDSVKNGKIDELTQNEKTKLMSLYPEFNISLDIKDIKIKNKAMADLLKKINQIKKDNLFLQNDSIDKIDAESAKLTRPSETEMIVFDRFIPQWRSDFNFAETKALSLLQYEKILKQIKALEDKRKLELRDMQLEIKMLDYVNHPQEAKDVTEQIKLINPQLSKLILDQRALIDKRAKLKSTRMNLKGVCNYLIKYLDEDSKDYLTSDQSVVAITDEMKKWLDKISEVGINWKDVLAKNNINNNRISKEEINTFYEILEDYIEKIDVLSYFEQFLDKKNANYLDDNATLKITDKIHTYLQKSEQFLSGHWHAYVKDLNLKEISKGELQKLVKDIKTFKVPLEDIAGIDEDKIEKYVDELKERQDINSQISKIEQKIKDLEANKTELENSESLVNFIKYMKLEDEVAKLSKSYKLVTNELRKSEKRRKKEITLSKPLQDALNDAYKSSDIQDWRKHYLGQTTPDPLVISHQLMEKIKQDLASRSKALSNELIELLPKKDCYQAQDYESFLTMGLPPEAEYYLSLDKASIDSGVEWGMNVEGMLSQMQQILKEEIPFDIFVNNCSLTTARILEAGAKGDFLKSLFQDRALGAIATPQLIANDTEDYLKVYQKSPKDNIFKKIARFNPIEKILGKQVHTIVSLDSAPSERNSAIATALLIAISTSPFYLIKGLLTPQHSFRQSVNLIKFARSKNHLGFKLASYIVGGLGMTVFALPATVETIIKAPFIAIGGIANRVQRRKLRQIKEPIDLPDQEVQARASKEAMLKSNLASLEDKIVTIAIKKETLALELALSIKKSGKIPMFETKTRLKLEKFIQNVDNEKYKKKLSALYNEVVDYSTEQVKAQTSTASQKRATAISPAREASTAKPNIINTNVLDEFKKNMSNLRKEMMDATPRGVQFMTLEFLDYVEKSVLESKNLLATIDDMKKIMPTNIARPSYDPKQDFQGKYIEILERLNKSITDENKLKPK